ncbi:MAG TPA: hypothetical protein VGE74_13655 [Gemmata sp.]
MGIKANGFVEISNRLIQRPRVGMCDTTVAECRRIFGIEPNGFVEVSNRPLDLPRFIESFGAPIKRFSPARFKFDGCGEVRDGFFEPTRVAVSGPTALKTGGAFGVEVDRFREVFDRRQVVPVLHEGAPARAVRAGTLRIEFEGRGEVAYGFLIVAFLQRRRAALQQLRNVAWLGLSEYGRGERKKSKDNHSSAAHGTPPKMTCAILTATRSIFHRETLIKPSVATALAGASR